jgi:hypothetical protein
MLGRLAPALGLLLFASSPASAYLVEVTTSVAVTDTDNQAAVQQALVTAVDSVLKEAIAFTPTLVVLTNATVVGDRLYVRLLVADRDGEKTFNELQPPDEDTPETVNLRI